MVVPGGSGSFEFRFAAYLVQHDRGLVLFDTALDPRAATDAEAIYGERASALDIRFTPDQRIDRQLEQLGHQPGDVTHVVLSHLHYDHAGGIHTFPDATFMVGEGEFPYAMWPDPAHDGFYRRDDLERARRYRWMEIGVDHDLFDDGSVVALQTPGHTPGHLSLIVRLPSRNFVLSGDAAHSREGLRGLLPMPANVHARESVRSLRRLLLIEQSADATIWVGHDQRDWAAFGAPRAFD